MSHGNGSKGTNAAGYDPETDELVSLFNPREDIWTVHFFWDGPMLVGKTAVGRATIDVLRINHSIAVARREYLIQAGLFPPNVDAEIE